MKKKYNTFFIIDTYRLSFRSSIYILKNLCIYLKNKIYSQKNHIEYLYLMKLIFTLKITQKHIKPKYSKYILIHFSYMQTKK